jgi:hypothetical protein
MSGMSDLALLFLVAVFPLVVWWFRSSRGKFVLSLAQCEEFFEYTSGRWLYNEDKREWYAEYVHTS